MNTQTQRLSSFRLITWNIDGLDTRDLEVRSTEVSNIVKLENADIVLIQEVVTASEPILRNILSDYEFVSGGGQFSHYYTAIFVHKSRAKYIKHKILKFLFTMQDRNLLQVKVQIGRQKLWLFTTHLESMDYNSATRKVQFRHALDSVLKKSSNTKSALLAGDMNITDEEVASAGGLGPGVCDVWELLGADKNQEFTWDTTVNYNLDWNSPVRPKYRFDRVYFLPSAKNQITPVGYKLIGMEQINRIDRYPSDHWGILCDFNIAP